MKITERSNYRVDFKGTARTDLLTVDPFRRIADRITIAGTVHPRALGDMGFGTVPDDKVSRDISGDYAERCAQIVDLLRQQYGHQVRTEILCDTEHTCSYCWRTWEELTQELLDTDPELASEPGDGPGMPLCCNAAQDEWHTQQRALAST